MEVVLQEMAATPPPSPAAHSPQCHIDAAGICVQSIGGAEEVVDQEALAARRVGRNAGQNPAH